jgi:crotonobetainyl-CoA:carnitine CoA-transferase CaiB-like acyl-CoA transferase
VRFKEGFTLLSDVVVIEAGSRAGTRYCAKLLVNLGAEVIRFSSGADDPRYCAEPGYVAYLDRGKRTVSVDAAAGLADVIAPMLGKRVVIVCDDDDREFLAAAAAARRTNAGVLVAVLSDYGLDGPSAGVPATDFTLQAEGGISLLHPTGDRAPVAAGVELSELAGGASAAAGVLTALIIHEAGAAPCASSDVDVDVSRFEAVVALQQYPWMWSTIEGHVPYHVPFNAVPGVESARDGWVCAVAVTEPQWKAFTSLAQVPGLEDPRFDTLPSRISHAAEVTELVRRYTTQHDVDELVELGARARVPITPVATPTTLPDIVPYASRGFFAATPDGGFEPGPIIRCADPVASTGRPTPAADRPAPATGRATQPRLPLAGLRVVEFGTFQAGPLVGSALAALGADVVKVEAVARPDLIRWGPIVPGTPRMWERSAGFMGANAGKRDITVDFTDPEGRDLLAKLIARSDVVLDNFLPRVLDSVGFDYAGVCALRPGIVMLRMPAWGSSGEWRDRPGFTYSVNATSGLSELTGYPDGPPLLTGTIIDPYAALHSTAGVLAAIRRQRRDGVGSLVEVALCDVAAHLTARAVTTTRDGYVPTRKANRGDTAAPQGVYRTLDDSWVAVSVCGDAQWSALRAFPGADGWADDHRFADHAGRVAHAAELDERFGAACASLSAADVVDTLRKSGVPAAELGTGAAVPDSPQLLWRQRVFEVDHAVAGRVTYIGAPARVLAAPEATRLSAPPLFGEHNREVLAELGVDESTIERMYASGKLGDSPWGLAFER